jgi:hypothetical protein
MDSTIISIISKSEFFSSRALKPCQNSRAGGATGQRSKKITFLDAFVMTSHNLSILFFALKPIVKKLFSIEIVIYHTSGIPKHNCKNIGHRKLPQTNMRKDPFEIMKLLFVYLWHLRFWRRFLKI